MKLSLLSRITSLLLTVITTIGLILLARNLRLPSVFLTSTNISATPIATSPTSVPDTTPTAVPTAPTSIASLPTRADGIWGRSEGMLVTPLPNEKLYIGDMIELQATPSPVSTRVNYNNDFPSDGGVLSLVITDTQTGQTERLGDDSGGALFGDANNEFVVWSFLCQQCINLQQGLHLYSLVLQTDTLISNLTSSVNPKIDGNWVAYMNIPFPKSHAGELHVHNVYSQEDLILADNVIVDRPGVSDYFAIQGAKVVWIAREIPQAMYAYDLSSRLAQKLNVPDFSYPLYLAIHGNFVIWLDDFWQGIDLTTNSYFSVPVVPAQWTNAIITKVGKPTITDQQLEWSLQFDGQTHYMIAPILSKSAP